MTPKGFLIAFGAGLGIFLVLDKTAKAASLPVGDALVGPGTAQDATVPSAPAPAAPSTTPLDDYQAALSHLKALVAGLGWTTGGVGHPGGYQAYISTTTATSPTLSIWYTSISNELNQLYDSAMHLADAGNYTQATLLANYVIRLLSGAPH